MHRIIFDFETGGTEDRHPNTQLAAIAVNEDWLEVASFERKLLFREEDCEPEALKVNHYDPALWKDAVPEVEAIRDFCRFVDPYRDIPKVAKSGKPYRVAQGCGHNAAGFDGPRLHATAKRHGIFMPVNYLVLDTLQLAMWKIPGLPDYKLSTIAHHLGIDASGAHDALVDVRMCAQIARALR